MHVVASAQEQLLVCNKSYVHLSPSVYCRYWSGGEQVHSDVESLGIVIIHAMWSVLLSRPARSWSVLRRRFFAVLSIGSVPAGVSSELVGVEEPWELSHNKKVHSCLTAFPPDNQRVQLSSTLTHTHTTIDAVSSLRLNYTVQSPALTKSIEACSELTRLPQLKAHSKRRAADPTLWRTPSSTKSSAARAQNGCRSSTPSTCRRGTFAARASSAPLVRTALLEGRG